MTVPGAPALPGVARVDNIGVAPGVVTALGDIKPVPVAPPGAAAEGVELVVSGAPPGVADGDGVVPPAPAPDVVTPPMVVDTMEDELTLTPLMATGIFGVTNPNDACDPDFETVGEIISLAANPSLTMLGTIFVPGMVFVYGSDDPVLTVNNSVLITDCPTVEPDDRTGDAVAWPGIRFERARSFPVTSPGAIFAGFLGFIPSWIYSASPTGDIGPTLTIPVSQSYWPTKKFVYIFLLFSI